MHAEADAIARAATRLTSSSTTAAVGVLTECKGKVIVTGVGKSGLVAQKFVASLTSVGYMAMYLNPLDACLLYTSPSPRDGLLSRMPSSA